MLLLLILSGLSIPFTCNICGQACTFEPVHYEDPETTSCPRCESNVRFRWIVYRLSMELFGRGLPLSQFPVDKKIKGIGLTDPGPIAEVLAKRFNYLNTFLTTEPKMDIRHDPSPLGELDFLIASEVFEHVEPPVSTAFGNAARLLKPSGVFLFSVPWLWDGDAATAIPELYDWKLDSDAEGSFLYNRKQDGQIERFRELNPDGKSPGWSFGHTREHFPHLHDWRLENDEKLINRRRDGTVEEFSNLCFHGGPGLALEMRLFTKQGIEDELRAAGFNHVEFQLEDAPEWGIIFGHPWSRPLTARR
jgi:SAM-dependent methyltransferase